MKLFVIHTHHLLMFNLMVLIVMFYAVPKPFNLNYVLVVFGIVATNIIFYFLRWSKSNDGFLDFEPIFIILSVIMGFTFPLLVFSFDESTAYYFSFWKQYDLNNINKGAVMSGVALTAFLIGSLKWKSKNYRSCHSRANYVNSFFIFVMLLLFFALFVITGGLIHYIQRYQGDVHEFSYTTYFESVVVSCSHVLLYNEFWNKKNKKNYKLNILYIGTTFAISFLFLIVGARTQAVFIALPIIIFFSKTYYPLSLKQFFIFMLIGILIMYFIQGFRSGYRHGDDMPLYYVVSDFLIPNTNTYLSCELVDKYGITYGRTMVSTILSTFPFAQGLVELLTGLGQNELQSGAIFTNYLGTKDGMGTNYIADSYLAFGLVGLLIFPYMFGKLLQMSKYNQHRYYMCLLYYVLSGFAVYLVRCGMFFVFKYIFLAFLLSYINRSISKVKYEDNNYNSSL